MNLFNNIAPENILPYDGVVHYYGPVLGAAKAGHYLERLLNRIEWKHDEALMFGRLIITARKVAWYGDAGFSYTYSKRTRHALAWTEDLLELKSIAEELSGETFNSCLLNLYHHGGEGMGWHSDDEKELVTNSAIASMSFGADRKFSLRHKQNQENISVLLEHGSLLVMKGATQAHWLHGIPKSKKIKTPRVNLTFRKMMER